MKPFKTCYCYSIALNFTLSKSTRCKSIFNQIAWICNKQIIQLINNILEIVLLVKLVEKSTHVVELRAEEGGQESTQDPS